MTSVASTENIQAVCSHIRQMSQLIHMFRSIGVVIVLWYVSSLFSQTFNAMDDALASSFHTLEAVAIHSERQLVK